MAGPAPEGLSLEAWREARAKFLADEYELKFEDCRKDLLQQEAALERFTEHDETILWFEHDLFCQINLIYLLDWFSKRPVDKTRLSLICVGEFPGVEDFRGLGQLTGEQLASLFGTRHEVTTEELGLAARAWAAYVSDNPQPIAQLIDEESSALPFLKAALRLHLMRFPSATNGLGRVENKALEMISHGPVGFKSLFPRFAKAEPTYGLGDSQFWNELKRLGKARHPLITTAGPENPERGRKSNRFLEASFELTEAGRAVLAGERDFIELNGIDLWLGGVHLADGAAMWRWDEQNGRLVRW